MLLRGAQFTQFELRGWSLTCLCIYASTSTVSVRGSRRKAPAASRSELSLEVGGTRAEASLKLLIDQASFAASAVGLAGGRGG